MERKSWPWRKKLELKTTSTFPSPPTSHDYHMSSPTTHHHLQHQQIRHTSPVVEDEESAHPGLNGADAQETAKMLTQRIMDVSSRLVAKDELANQQARIAKEAVQDLISKDEQLKQHVMALKEEKAAREKADTAYWATKQELEKVCQQKSLVEARMGQLNGALKECMDEMHHAKDQLEHKAQEATSRQREWDKLRVDLETECAHLKRQLMEAKAENIAVSKSLQERARSLTEINEHKGKVESESKILQVQIESLHKDMDAYKYEIHLLKKEIQIRSDEKDQNKKVTEATHKQHLEDVKKIAKLDSECSRLRGLIRKKLPGPAAIAQMRVESDHVGKKRLPSPKLSAVSSQDKKELEALTERLISMEDETKLLKEALAKRTAELQWARQLCARTTSKLSSAEGILEALARGQPFPTSHNEASARSIKLDLTQQQAIALPPVASPSIGGESMEVMDWAASSEDGNNDDELSSAESWASALIAELSHLKKDDENATAKTEENCKPGRILNLPQDFDLQTALQELNSKLSSIGECILALPSSMKYADEQSSTGNGSESKSLHFGVLSQIMEEFTHVKQLLAEVGKVMELERNRMQIMEVDRRVQGSETSKADGSVVINECDVEAKHHVEIDFEKQTYMGVIRKIMEALLALAAESKQGDMEDITEQEKGVFKHLQKAVGVLEGGGALKDASEEVAATVLCKVRDMLNLHYGCNLEDGATPSLVVGDVEGGNNAAAQEINNPNCEIVASNLSSNESAEAASGKSAANPVDSAINAAGNSVVEEVFSGRDSCSVGEADGKLITKNCELTLQMEILQHEVERLTSEREEIEAKLMAAEEELERQRATVATLEAESLQLGHDKASLANELSDTSSLKQKLENDLADARASLDDLRQQVATLTPELAARCEELKSNVMYVSDVGTPARGRKSIERDADAKSRKELEIASAKAQLAECQRSILVLGNQLSAMSSLQGEVAEQASFDSSLESATSTDQMNLPPLGEDMPVPQSGIGSVQVPVSNAKQRRAPAGYVRTRGGRLISADQFWGSSGDIFGSDARAIPTNPGACYSFGSRHVPLPRHVYSAACSQSPLHEYVSESSRNLYSPPETALSSPAGSPARYDLQMEHSGRAPQAAKPLKIVNKAAAVTGSSGGPSPSPVIKPATPSRIARFFTRAKK